MPAAGAGADGAVEPDSARICYTGLDLGSRSGLSDLEVGFVENGSKPLRTEDLLCLAKGLGISPAAFFEGW